MACLTSMPPSSEVDIAPQERLAAILELRAADPQQRAMLDSYLSEVEFPPAARVLEIGCGRGAVTRLLVRRPGVAAAVGVDPSPVFVAKAGELAGRVGQHHGHQELDGRPFGVDAAARRLEAGLLRTQDGTRMPPS
jgi:SAM-dependent methyltransferase